MTDTSGSLTRGLQPVRDLLAISLSAAVPLFIADMRGRPWPELIRVARESADEVAAHGDILMFGSRRKGETAQAFNALARGLAVLAHAPGGVDFMGGHWEVEPPDGARPDAPEAQPVRRLVETMRTVGDRL